MLKRQLAQTGASHQSRQQEASDRESWRSSERKASFKFEAERHGAAKDKRRRQKERAASLSPQPKLSSVQSAVGCTHQVSVSTATNERAGIGHQPSEKSSSARNEPSSVAFTVLIVRYANKPLVTCRKETNYRCT